MARILILTAGFGEGHNSAARGLAGAVSAAPGPHVCEVHDLILESYGSAAEFMRRAYVGAINRAPRLWQVVYDLVDRTDMVSGNLGVLGRMADRLRQLVAAFRPDIVASTYPVYGYLLDRLFRENSARRIPVATIVTDSISINSVWTRAPSDCFVVPNEDTAEVMRGMGVEPERIRVDGFPVDPAFADLAAHGLRSPGPPWRILYMVNSGKKHAPGLVARLLEMDGIELTVTAGRDADLKAEIDRVVADSGRSATVLGWSDQMPRLMSENHVLIGKAGGATVQEALAAGCPIIITQVVPGQEEGNATLIERHACGCVAGHEKHVPARLAEALADDAAILREWQEAIRGFSHPEASHEIVQFLIEKAGR